MRLPTNTDRMSAVRSFHNAGRMLLWPHTFGGRLCQHVGLPQSEIPNVARTRTSLWPQYKMSDEYKAAKL